MELTEHSAENLGNYASLLTEFEHMTTLLTQLMNSDYRTLDLYLNNCSHLILRFTAIYKLIGKPEFEDYLKHHDAALYYNVNSVGLALRLFENMLTNMRDMLGTERLH
ncbi:hypothetical protein ECA3244 [Pectobacterium atrosepticum SCRI1043]|uniref:Uncharacterized protein n=1 Tax=Pectobacterium atrosepticum (strain SCRI 1043 / ATCC BAA-672) TaxID=218491 RepID=Q6D252_PECAS|nr:hypothetical protein [Pectobacterium atrosepticum]GKV84601.1 hypothetical protein PEC301296_09130 [Pectobacterium carotovorum subsp. carotovorum]AIA72066.1 hypothetical protein EV46_16080 [Pectobacterium atrosepticum]AIK15034.1 hypothetical protein GZ59_32590 [Pectobacterium atrosepticum]ATY91808.1 hypothetical protein CVS35_16275 [Pectobacterium atrosepticum]KFX15155.1 hypothetical protein JV34_10425 [Pectobacterium atrosepticum]